MPSNRDLAQSRRAIETALAYCKARDAVLIVADNSGDAAKKAHWKGRSSHLRYLETENFDANGNFLATFHAAETPFVMPMGDDDELHHDAAVPAFDLSALPADHIGVRPVTHVWLPETGKGRVKEFAISAKTPAQRILEYIDAAQGDNSAFYSIFRREPYLALMELFIHHHPTKGGYCDWALMAALMSYGRMALDRGTVFRYNFTGWSTKDEIDQRNSRLYTSAGLPADAAKYSALLLYLDLFVFTARKSPPTPEEHAGLNDLMGRVLAPFIREVGSVPRDYSETMVYLAELAGQETDMMSRFHIALVMANQIQDGLKDRYVEYYQRAVSGN